MDPVTGAALIFSGISKIKGLFDSGKELISDISGESSTATSPEELKAEFESLDANQQMDWIGKMGAITRHYEAQTERLKAEGFVTATIEEKIDNETASEIAYMRQTTRPWAVRKSMHLIWFPFYLIGIDVIQTLFNTWIIKGIFRSTDGVAFPRTFDFVFGATGSGLMDKVGNLIGPMPKTLAGMMYVEAVAWAAGIVLAYMGLREMGKFRDKNNGPSLMSKAAGAIKKTGFFNKLFG